MKRSTSLNAAELLVVVGGVLAAIGAFLPWATLSSGFLSRSIGGMDVTGSDAVVVLAAGLLTAIPWPWLPWEAPARPGVSILLGLILLALTYLETSTLRPTGGDVTLTIGVGLWAVGIGGVLALLGGLARWRMPRDQEDPVASVPES